MYRFTKNLRCYVRKTDHNTWYAHCIDLCLDTEGTTLEEAVRSLGNSIEGYLGCVFDGQSVEGLFPRRSPWYFRKQYYLLKLRCLLRLPSDRVKLFTCDFPMERLRIAEEISSAQS